MRRQPKTGASRMTELGKKQVCFWLTAAELEVLEAAAQVRYCAKAFIARQATLAAAKQILHEHNAATLGRRRSTRM